MTSTVLSRDLALGMLRRGSTGSEILDILNVIAPDSVSDSDTDSDVIEF